MLQEILQPVLWKMSKKRSIRRSLLAQRQNLTQLLLRIGGLRKIKLRFRLISLTTKHFRQNKSKSREENQIELLR